MRFKGDFQLPSIDVECGYSKKTFPVIKCNFVATKVTGDVPPREKWHWKYKTDSHILNGFKYESKVQTKSKKKLNDLISEELHEVLDDFLGTRDLAFNDNGKVIEVRKGEFSRSYDTRGTVLYDDNVELYKNLIVGEYSYPSISFDCIYRDNVVKCSFGDKGYTPIYEDDNEIIKSRDRRLDDYLRYAHIKFNKSHINSELNNEQDTIAIINEIEYNPVIVHDRERLRELERNPWTSEELEDSILNEFNYIMQIVLRRGALCFDDDESRVEGLNLIDVE